MSVTLAQPFRLDAAGSIGVIPQGGARHALEVVRHIIACRVGERPLAPVWGLVDPLSDGVDEADVRAALDLCEPDIAVSGVTISTTAGTGSLDIIIDATWRA